MKRINTTSVKTESVANEDFQYELAFIICGILTVVGIAVGTAMQLIG